MHRDTSRRQIIRIVCGLITVAAMASAQPPEAAPPLLAVSQEPADLIFPEPTSSEDLYRAWGRAFGIRVQFDRKFRSSESTLELAGATALESLHILNLSTGHFAVPIGETTILVADDTPQNRRLYETQVSQTFVFEHLEVKDAMTIIRSLLGAKHVAAHATQNAMVVRDSVEKVRIVAELLAVLDKPRAEAAIDVEVFHLSGRQRDEAAAKLRGGDVARRGFPQRLTAAQLDDLRGAATLLAAPSFNVLSGETGRFKLEDSYTVPAAGGVAHVTVGLAFEATARVKPASDEVEISGQLTARDAVVPDGADPMTASRETMWSARLGEDESLLLSGFLRTGRRAAGRDRGSMPVSFFDPAAADHGEVLIAVSPRIVGEPVYSERDLAPLCIGTESNIKLCGTL